jgi:hypothetical protein
MSHFEFEIRDREGVAVRVRPLREGGVYILSISDGPDLIEAALLEEPELRTLAIALTMAADELKERPNAAR